MSTNGIAPLQEWVANDIKALHFETAIQSYKKG